MNRYIGSDQFGKEVGLPVLLNSYIEGKQM